MRNPFRRKPKPTPDQRLKQLLVELLGERFPNQAWPNQHTLDARYVNVVSAETTGASGDLLVQIKVTTTPPGSGFFG